MKIATWNVNSLRVRHDAVLDWCEEHDPDVLCLQETKTTDQEFPEDSFGDIDYEVIFTGQNAYNGVAIAARDEFDDVHKVLPGDPEDDAKRLLSANLEGIRVINIYLPNGQSLDSPKFPYKLKWMERLRSFLDDLCTPSDPVIILGDFNLCPTALDHHWAVESRERSIFTTPEERERYQAFLDWGLTDAYRHLYPDKQAFTWWDYRAGAWERNKGLRIDHALVSAPVLERLKDVTIDTMVRGQEQPSDHVPVTVELED